MAGAPDPDLGPIFQIQFRHFGLAPTRRHCLLDRMVSELPSGIVAGINFIGRSGGVVKALSGFKKGHHTVPDAANATTNGFLGKICVAELTAEAERTFQQTRTDLEYKRKDISLSVASPAAILTSRDFTWEIFYALEEADPARYAVTRILRELRNAELARTDAFTAIFSGAFSEISFALKKGARIEAMIDAIEFLDGANGLEVAYPSDCRECSISVKGVEVRVRCTGAAIDLVFPRAGSPQELMTTFAAVREAFAVSKVLGGMLQ